MTVTMCHDNAVARHLAVDAHRARQCRPAEAELDNYLTLPGGQHPDASLDAFRFADPDAGAGPDSPRYATIYDIVTSDPATAWPDTEPSPDYPTHLFSDPRAKLVAPVLRASYAFVGSQARPGEHGRLTGIHVVLSNGGDDTGRQPRESEALRTGLFYSAC